MKVQILCGTPGKEGAYLEQLYNPVTGEFFAPMLPEHPVSEGIRKVHGRGYKGSGIKTAVIDTGMMLDHPLIKQNLEESVDFTGEGPNDLNGHGTIVTLILLATVPGARLLNVKVLNACGEAESEDVLIMGIQEAVKKGTRVINLSAGVINRYSACRGDCKVCQAAEDAAKKGVVVIAAAGNKPGITTCPATVGIVKKESGVISGAAHDLEKRELYSGIGNVVAPVGKYRLEPVK